MWLAFFAGLSLLLGLTAWQGVSTMTATLGVAGWRILWLVPWFAVPLAAATWGWATLFVRGERPPAPVLVFARWIGFAVNQLLPVARVGGEIVRTRLAMGRGDGGAVTATVIADKTAQVASVALFALAGVGALAFDAVAPDLVLPGILGIVVIAGAGAAFYITQRRGGVDATGRWLSRIFPESGRSALRDGADRAQSRLSSIYGSWRFVGCIAAHVVFRAGLTVEVWLAFRFLGDPVDLSDALILEGVNQVLRAAAFVVPGALGAQETGFVVLGSVLGVPTPVALSVSLCKRARELLVGLPALFAWQLHESRTFRERPTKPSTDVQRG